ncbi:hypothetical protein [Pseudomonas sp.]|uniref:hypothetical protein n=1 Tax=Pseudomonas sp. TaxID=306 RepID=UPI0029135FD8|nr:hypothetical protein [Pseudomonas sp.]MDU4254547.1 hypothetical protein [Pseudomonas sp.]
MTSASPFYKYRDILLNGSYSAAGALQDFALSCYNGNMAQFRGDALANFDKQHFAIFVELATYYHQYREDDQHLLDVGAAIWDSRRERGRDILERLATHKSIKPHEYPDGTEHDYYDQLRWLERQVEIMKAKSWIDADA